jgi:hypothetical protein
VKDFIHFQSVHGPFAVVWSCPSLWSLAYSTLAVTHAVALTRCRPHLAVALTYCRPSLAVRPHLAVALTGCRPSLGCRPHWLSALTGCRPSLAVGPHSLSAPLWLPPPGCHCLCHPPPSPSSPGALLYYRGRRKTRERGMMGDDMVSDTTLCALYPQPHRMPV